MSIMPIPAIAYSAVDIFMKLYPNGSAVASVFVENNTANIDCINSSRRIVLVTAPERPGQVCIGVGNRETGEIELQQVLPIGELDDGVVLSVMEKHFVR